MEASFANPGNHPVLLFDGVCNLCNQSVQWVIRRDTQALFRFAALQSDAGRQLLQKAQMPLDELNTVVLYHRGQVLTRSDVPLRIFSLLGGFWPLLGIFRFLPKALRDAVYNWIAQNRYRWFGRRDSCMIPTPELKSRFLG